MKFMKNHFLVICIIVFGTICLFSFFTVNINPRSNTLKRNCIEQNVSINSNVFHGPQGSKQTTMRTITPHISTQELSNNTPVPLLRPKIRFLNYELKDNNECDQEKCLKDKKIKWKMYTFVKSKAEHVNRREIIRMSWGGVFYMNEVKFKTVFVIGKANETTQLLIEKEIQLFGDILQIDENDGYQNVPMKVLAGMQWAADNLADDVLYSTADDDMGVNVLKLQKEIEKAKARTISNKWPEFPIICSYEMRKNLGPVRKITHKNFVSKQKYRWTKWPMFCLGGMYSTSVRVIKQLYEISRSKDMINTDDVWITGILRNILGMPDEMLIRRELVVAKHLTDYYDKNPNKTKSQVLDLWKQCLKGYESQNWCTC